MAQKYKNQDLTDIIIKAPLVTEKATNGVENGAYTFVVDKRATKIDIKKAIHDLYSVKPVKVRVVSVPGKRVFGRGHGGVKPGFKKAIVYVAKGDKIDIT